jgi:hypothetical protein
MLRLEVTTDCAAVVIAGNPGVEGSIYVLKLSVLTAALMLAARLSWVPEKSRMK